MILRETDDAEYIKSVLLHESIWEWISDDSCSKDGFEPVITHGIDYLIPVRDGVPLGLLMLVKCNAATVELHTAILPEHRGKGLSEVFLALQSWAYGKGFSRIRTWVSDSNRPAYVSAKRIGFDLVGTEQKAFLKDGKLHDLHLFGVTLCQQQYQ